MWFKDLLAFVEFQRDHFETCAKNIIRICEPMRPRQIVSRYGVPMASKNLLVSVFSCDTQSVQKVSRKFC